MVRKQLLGIALAAAVIGAPAPPPVKQPPKADSQQQHKKPVPSIFDRLFGRLRGPFEIGPFPAGGINPAEAPPPDCDEAPDPEYCRSHSPIG